MTRREIGGGIFCLALLIGLIETAYFGWNLLPQTPAEGAWDTCCAFVAGIGAGMYLWSLPKKPRTPKQGA